MTFIVPIPWITMLCSSISAPLMLDQVFVWMFMSHTGICVEYIIFNEMCSCFCCVLFCMRRITIHCGPYDIFVRIHQDNLLVTGEIIRLFQCKWCNPERYGYNLLLPNRNKTQQCAMSVHKFVMHHVHISVASFAEAISIFVYTQHRFCFCTWHRFRFCTCIYRGYPAKRVLSSMQVGPFWQDIIDMISYMILVMHKIVYDIAGSGHFNHVLPPVFSFDYLYNFQIQCFVCFISLLSHIVCIFTKDQSLISNVMINVWFQMPHSNELIKWQNFELK